MVRRGTRTLVEHDAALRRALDQMEPDLRLLDGTSVILQALSETADAVEPIALAAVAHLVREATGRLESSWREARDALR